MLSLGCPGSCPMGHLAATARHRWNWREEVASQSAFDSQEAWRSGWGSSHRSQWWHFGWWTRPRSNRSNIDLYFVASLQEILEALFYPYQTKMGTKATGAGLKPTIVLDEVLQVVYEETTHTSHSCFGYLSDWCMPVSTWSCYKDIVLTRRPPPAPVQVLPLHDL